MPHFYLKILLKKKKNKKKEKEIYFFLSIFLYEHSVDPFLDGPNSKPTKL